MGAVNVNMYFLFFIFVSGLPTQLLADVNSTTAINSTAIPVPATPPEPSAILTGTTIHTSWEPVSGATAYRIRQSVNDIWQAEIKKQGRFLTHDFIVEPGNSYKYQLQACKGPHCSSWSYATASISVPANPAIPAIPSGLVAELDGFTIETRWNSVSGAASYEIQQRENDSWQLAIIVGSNQSYDFSVVAGNQYQYRVRACNQNDECSSWSATTATIEVNSPVVVIPDAPAKPEVGRDGMRILVSWHSVSNAAWYQLRTYVNGSIESEGDTGPDTYINVTGEAGNSYQFWVKACNQDGCSDWSPASNVIQLPSIPEVVRFEWLPSEVQVGEETTFYWDILNVAECYEETATDPTEAKASSGASGPKVFDEPDMHITQWYCTDLNGQRFPASGYLEAMRTVKESTRSLTYQYDNFGRLYRVKDGENLLLEYQYDAAGNRKQVVHVK